jgi:oligopeptide transport system permease protein
MKGMRLPLALVLGLVVLAALAGPLSIRVAGFPYDRPDPASPLLAPGGISVQPHPRTYVPDGRLMSLLDSDRDGEVACSLSAEGRHFCPELEELPAVASVLRRGFQAAQGEAGVDRDEWDRTLLSIPERMRPRLWSEVLDLDRDRLVSRDEWAQGTSFLALDGEDAALFDVNGDTRLTADELAGTPETRAHLLGTDSLGRDLLARLLYGLRVSLLVSLAAATVSLLLGTLLGLLSGLVGGTADRIFLRLLEVLQSVPFLFLVILLSVFSRDVLKMRWQEAETAALAQAVLLFAALGAVQWFSLARYARGLAVSLKQAPFVQSLSGMGFSTPRLVVRHILPNTVLPISAYAVLLVPALVLEEAFLSFLGFGIQPPYPSLGTLLGEGVRSMGRSPLLLLAPALTVLVLAWSVNLLGDSLARRLAGGRGRT